MVLVRIYHVDESLAKGIEWHNNKAGVHSTCSDMDIGTQGGIRAI
jgi:hypothetical protein